MLGGRRLLGRRLMGRLGVLLLVVLLLVVRVRVLDDLRAWVVLLRVRVRVVGWRWQALLRVGVMLEDRGQQGAGSRQICTKEEAAKVVAGGGAGCKLRSGSAVRCGRAARSRWSRWWSGQGRVFDGKGIRAAQGATLGDLTTQQAVGGGLAELMAQARMRLRGWVTRGGQHRSAGLGGCDRVQGLGLGARLVENRAG